MSIALAAEFPQSEFVGIDLAATAIEAGREEAQALGLTNLRLEVMDLMDAGPELGSFDYVVAHGVYSWVPAHLRDKILQIVKDVLAPQGIAYVSYNAMPGGRLRELLRDLMLFDLRDVEGNEGRTPRARNCLEWFAASQAIYGEARKFLIAEAEAMAGRDPSVLFHDELSAVYQPVYFHEFAAHASKFGLQFLAEASLFEMQAGDLPKETVARIDQASGGDRIARDQYLDFVKCRKFRQTLLCHDGVKLACEPQPAAVRRFRAASPISRVAGAEGLPEGAEEFRGPRGVSVTTAYPLSKAAMTLLGEAWPAALSFADLLTRTRGITGEESDPGRLAEILLRLHLAGILEFHIASLECVSAPTERPRVSDFARSRATRGKPITTNRLATIELQDDASRRLVSLLDGTRDAAALTVELAPLLNQPEETVRESVERNLRNFGEMGLLVG